MNAISDFLSVLVQGLLVLTIPILVAAAIPWLLQKAKEVKQRLSAEQLAILQKGVAMAVSAAEQSGVAGQIAANADDKRIYAIKVAQSYANRIGLNIDAGEVAALIESEVHNQFTKPAPKNNNPQVQAELLDKAVATAVMAIQTGGVKELVSQLNTGLVGSRKKDAVDFARSYLAQHGITVDNSLLEGLINAEVVRLQLEVLKKRKGS